MVLFWQFQTPIHFPALKRGLILKYEAKSTQLDEFDVRNPLVVSIITRRSEELRLCNVVWNLTISHPDFKRVSSLDWTVHFLVEMIGNFPKVGLKVSRSV